jgi:tripartite-type tricarboxylate transporter receptor subunit TctC
VDGLFRIAAAAVTMFTAVGTASAQSPFPSRPVHIFVPYAAGGAVDILARTLGEVVSRQWGQTVVVENRPGAGGVVASQALVTSPPDGYTLIVVASGHATNPFLYPKIPYDTFNDFAPISLLASSPNILLVRADSPFRTLADMIAQARAKPGSLSFAHAGTGTSTHLAGELMKLSAKVFIVHIPYKGAGPMMTAILSGEVEMATPNVFTAVPYVKSGRLRAIAVTSLKPSATLPGVPTVADRVAQTVVKQVLEPILERVVVHVAH